MIEIRRIVRHSPNFAVFKDGTHVDAIVRLYGDPTNTWRLWKDKANFTNAERRVIQAKLDELNGVADQGEQT